MEITEQKKVHVPMKTASDFSRALNKPAFKSTVVQVVTSYDLANLVKTLNNTTRPFAVAILEAK